MKNILITSAGQRVSLVKAFQNEAKKMSSDLKVYTVDLNPILAPGCLISDGYEQIVHVNDDYYISNLLEVCLRFNIGMIIPTIDTELLKLSMNKYLFEAKNIKIIVGSNEFIKKCRDKRLTNIFFKDNGIEIPKTISKINPTFPLFIKPYDGSLSKDIDLIQKESELKEHHFSNEKLMFMEYIDPKYFYEYTIDAYYDKNHELKCAVPRKRIFVRSGEINKGVTHKNEIVDFVSQKLKNIPGAIGCITIQVFFNPETKVIIGIEINPRFGGGFPLSYLAGANYPLWLIQEYLDSQEIPFFKDWKNNLLMLRYDAEILMENYEQ